MCSSKQSWTQWEILSFVEENIHIASLLSSFLSTNTFFFLHYGSGGAVPRAVGGPWYGRESDPVAGDWAEAGQAMDLEEFDSSPWSLDLGIHQAVGEAVDHAAEE